MTAKQRFVCRLKNSILTYYKFIYLKSKEIILISINNRSVL